MHSSRNNRPRDAQGRFISYDDADYMGISHPKRSPTRTSPKRRVGCGEVYVDKKYGDGKKYGCGSCGNKRYGNTLIVDKFSPSGHLEEETIIKSPGKRHMLRDMKRELKVDTHRNGRMVKETMVRSPRRGEIDIDEYEPGHHRHVEIDRQWDF